MLPCFAFSYGVDRLLTNAVLSPQFRQSRTVLEGNQDLPNTRLRKLSGINPFASCGSFRMCIAPVLFPDYSPTFGGLIPSVVEMCSKEKMIRSYAGRVVATVKDAQIAWGSVRHLPRNPVSMNKSAVMFYSAVAVFIAARRPYSNSLRAACILA